MSDFRERLKNEMRGLEPSKVSKSLTKNIEKAKLPQKTRSFAAALSVAALTGISVWLPAGRMRRDC